MGDKPNVNDTSQIYAFSKIANEGEERGAREGVKNPQNTVNVVV